MNEPTEDSTRLGRRRFLAIAGGLAAAASVGLATSPAASAAPPANPPARPHSLATFAVEGSNASVTLLSGPSAVVLLHVARRFHYEVDALGAEDITGYAEVPAGTPFAADYRSGTAIAILAARYPAGATGGLFPHELAIVRDVLAECEGVVRWGGDFRETPKEGHFRVDVKPGDPTLARVAKKIGGWVDGPGRGAPADPFAPGRRQAAERLAERQLATR
ncbi:hypothetical protein ADK67_35805 [Saccharothrix sp. NRRL B-16348]|uniref:hypothetical protein n=1 Tax=Saccharothrix sp. NRRL B-16348 TaxID=1415542 RepID=UPI0006AF045F|nr:hypothetical protein [Saccharothrix sp. NRRL B-16348]KOX18585.1 hypothetical protein ADK67_35805 [Saccharothrix sp. NRRL B-16348]